MNGDRRAIINGDAVRALGRVQARSLLDGDTRDGFRRATRAGRAVWWAVGVVGGLGLLLLMAVTIVLDRLAPPALVDYSAQYRALREELHPPGSGLEPDEAIKLLVDMKVVYDRAVAGLGDLIDAEYERRLAEYERMAKSGSAIPHTWIPPPSSQFTVDLKDLYAPGTETDAFKVQLARDLLSALESAGYFDDAARLFEASSCMSTQQFDSSLLPMLGSVRAISKSLSARAAVRWQAGDAAGAIEMVRLNNQLARLTESARALIFTLVADALWNISHEGLRNVVQSGRADEAALDAIEAHVRSYDASPDLANMLRGERLWQLNYLQSALQSGSLGWDDEFGIKDRLQHPLPQRISRVDELFARVGAMAGQTPAQIRSSGPHEKYANGTDELIASSEASLLKAMRMAHSGEMSRRCLLIVIALERHRLARGAYPDSLDALVPEFIAELPQDPYADDGRFVYRRVPQSVSPDGTGALPETYRLHSVWQDGVDSGGVHPADLDYSPAKGQAR